MNIPLSSYVDRTRKLDADEKWAAHITTAGRLSGTHGAVDDTRCTEEVYPPRDFFTVMYSINTYFGKSN